tara:strand:+ start:6388 stop:6789 length:402 start_codon:yes stop_codon:yes gene_type:complete
MKTTAEKINESRNEVSVLIEMQDGEKFTKSFKSCDDAWNWERETKRYHAKRRAIADRRFIETSFSYGCTITGKEYGNVLTNNAGHRQELNTKFKLDDLKSEARRELRRTLLESGETFWTQDFTDAVEGNKRSI